MLTTLQAGYLNVLILSLTLRTTQGGAKAFSEGAKRPLCPPPPRKIPAVYDTIVMIQLCFNGYT